MKACTSLGSFGNIAEVFDLEIHVYELLIYLERLNGR